MKKYMAKDEEEWHVITLQYVTAFFDSSLVALLAVSLVSIKNLQKAY